MIIKQFSAIVLFALCTQTGYSVTFPEECNGNVPGHYTQRFVDNNDGTVLDELTKLTWTRCSLDQQWNNINQSCDFEFNAQAQIVRNPLNWQDTLLAVQDFNLNTQLGNNSDWRLPNIKELASLSDLGCIDRTDINDDIAIDNNVFLFPSANYWSSTPVRLKTGTSLILVDPNSNVIEKNKVWRFGFKLTEFGAQIEGMDTLYYARLVRQ